MSVRIRSLLLWLALSVSVWYSFHGCKKQTESPVAKTSISQQALSDDFVGDQVCASCHREEYELWKRSHHYFAMLPATDSTVRANFQQIRLEADGVVSDFYRRNGDYFIRTQGPAGQIDSYRIAYTFGYYPLQQFLVRFPGGRYQVTRQSWDVDSLRWYHQYAGQHIAANDWLHWTRGGQNWNSMCAECHSTNVRMGYDLAADTFHTTWSLINVSCEACHGPGKSHVEWARSAGGNTSRSSAAGAMLLNRQSPATHQVAVCAPCHSRRLTLLQEPMTSFTLLNYYLPEIVRTPLYHADGQINEEVYEYGSYLQSKMYMHGVKCTDCHDPHAGTLKMTGNMLCLQCHKKELNDLSHTFHKPESAGSQCINCHMPAKVYMGIDERRDHSFRVPRPDLSVRFGVPNACNNCHTDRSAAWAAEQVRKWYGPNRAYHYSEDLIAGSNGNPINLHKLCVPDTNVPPIIHATALYYMQFFHHRDNIHYLIKALSHPEPMIRFHALRTLAFYPEKQWLSEASALLADSVRAVRVAAVELLLEHGDTLPEPHRMAFRRARDDFDRFLKLQAPFPTGRLMMGDVQARLSNYTAAEMHYRKALAMDSLLVPARLSLVTMYNILSRNQEALAQLKLCYEMEPSNERVNYFLALLYAELKQYKNAHDHFVQAARVSRNPRLFYNFGLLLEQMNAPGQAEAMYRKGLQLAPDDIDLNYVMTLFYYKQQRKKEALPYALKLLELMPQNENYRQMIQMLQVP